MAKASLLVVFTVLILNIAKTDAEFALQTSTNSPDLTAEHITDKSIMLNIHKSGGKYALQDVIKISDGAKSGYLDDYQIYKGKTYNGRVVSYLGKTLGYFPASDMQIVICRDNFDSKTSDEGGCEEISDGDIPLRIPYFPNGKDVEIYSPQGEKIFTANLSAVAVCNENNVCENSENIDNCPSDCQKNEPAIDTNKIQNNKSLDISSINNQTEQNQQKNNLLPYIITACFAILAGIIIFFWIKRKRSE